MRWIGVALLASLTACGDGSLEKDNYELLTKVEPITSEAQRSRALNFLRRLNITLQSARLAATSGALSGSDATIMDLAEIYRSNCTTTLEPLGRPFFPLNWDTGVLVSGASAAATSFCPVFFKLALGVPTYDLSQGDDEIEIDTDTELEFTLRDESLAGQLLYKLEMNASSEQEETLGPVPAGLVEAKETYVGSAVADEGEEVPIQRTYRALYEWRRDDLITPQPSDLIRREETIQWRVQLAGKVYEYRFVHSDIGSLDTQRFFLNNEEQTNVNIEGVFSDSGGI